MVSLAAFRPSGCGGVFQDQTPNSDVLVLVWVIWRVGDLSREQSSPAFHQESHSHVHPHSTEPCFVLGWSAGSAKSQRASGAAA